MGRATWCKRCQAFNLEDFLQGRWIETSARDPVAYFGKPSAIRQDPSCALCNALASIAADEHDGVVGTGFDGYCLYVLPSTLALRPTSKPSTDGFANRVLEYTKNRGDSAWLVVRNQHSSMGPFFFIDVPRSANRYGCLAEYSPNFNKAGLRVRIIDPARADFDGVKQWLDVCATRHGKECRASATRSLPRGFVVINCKTRRLQPLPEGATFVALSYVWGTDTANNNNYSLTSKTGLAPFPQTIEDAVTVTVRIGIHYIWVDRYCVPQQDCDEKQEQIQNMHEIYSAADLVIIAAAGDGPDHGLPGVSRARSQPPAADIQIGDSGSRRCLISTGRGVEEAIRGAVWTSRAWTFQEGLVSKKKLIFTHEQVYFHCTQREYREAIQEDHDVVAKTDSRNDLIGSPFRCALLYSGLEQRRLDQLIFTLQNYSSRSIGSEGDFLNAATGILNMYQQVFSDSLRHIWGQPLQYDPRRTLGDMMASALRWELQRKAKRRAEFPSWSWIGWHGCMMGWPGENDKWLDGDSEVSVRLTLRDGSAMGEDECRNLMTNPFGLQRLSAKLDRFIIIEAETVHLRIHHRGAEYMTSSNKWEPTFCDEAGTTNLGPMTSASGFVVTEKVKEGDDLYDKLCNGLVWLGLVFVRADFILVIRDMGTHYERIGFVRYSTEIKGQKLADMCCGKKVIRLG